jgi:hypothetical protein
MSVTIAVFPMSDTRLAREEREAGAVGLSGPLPPRGLSLAM